MKKLLQLLCFFLTFANKNIDILIKSFFMGKFLQLKRCLAAAVIAFLGVTATWADDVVLYESNFSTDPATDGWTAVDKSTKTGTTWEFKSNGLRNSATGNYGPVVRIMRDWNALHNDYYVSPAMELTAGTKYTITTATVINNNSTITFEVGTSKDDMSKFSSLKTLAGKTELDYKNDGMYETIEYTPSTSGTFYFAYHAVQTEEGSGIAYLCGLKVTYEGTVTPGPDPDPEPGVSNKVFSADFSTQPTDWTIIDNSNTKEHAWNWNANAFYDGISYTNKPAYRILQTNWDDSGSDDYLISPALQLTKGKYKVTASSARQGDVSATLTLECGKSNTDMTTNTVVGTLTPALAYTDDRNQTFELNITEDGTYYLSYHVYEDPNIKADDRKQKTYIFGLDVEKDGTVDPTPDPEPGENTTILDANFSTEPTGWAIIDNDKDNTKWTYKAFSSFESKPAVQYLQYKFGNGADDYYVSPALELKKGVTYNVTTSTTYSNELPTLTLELGTAQTDATTFNSVTSITPSATYDGKDQIVQVTVPADGTYYLAYHIKATTGGGAKAFLFGMKVEKGASAPQPAVTPAAVTNLAAAVDYAASTVTLTWTNPTKDAEGNDLTEKVGAKIYKNGELMETIDELTGETTTKVLSPTPFEGEATFAVKAFIGEKESEEASVKVNMTKPVIIPAAVTNFDATVDYDAATVTLTWTNPTKDASGKELTEKVGAKIYKDEVLVETIDELTGETTTKVLSPTPFEGEATFAVKTFIGEKESEAVSKKVDLTKPVPPVTAEEIPYTADLTKAETVATFKTIDANNDGITWTTVEGLNGLTYDSDDAKVAANDWAITPIIKFEADKNYAVAACFTRSGAFDEDVIDVYAGDEPTADKMTTKIGTFKIEDNATEAKLRFIVAEEGNKYIGFHVVTPGSGDNGQLSLASVSVTALEKATPLAVENLEGTVNSDDKTITLTWTNPTKDTEGYPIAETLGVKLYENDVLVKTVDDASEGTLVYSPENFSGETTYKVVPFIGAKDGEGATVTLNLNDLTGDLVLVKAFEFNKTAATSWTIINADKNSSKWEFDYDGFYFGGGSAADDWLISPALALNTKDRYVLKYELKTAWQPSNNTFFADIDVTVGQGATANAQTTTVSSHKGLSQNGYTEFQTKQFSLAADGQYNIGFHVTGIKGNANMRNLAVYAVGEATNSITEITEGGVVAYNKSNGALFVPAGSKVALYAANGTMAMQTIADGNAISLNSLANGIYVMKITSAEGKVMTRKIVK